ncbi:glycosyltransferase family 4 protein [Leptospira sp. GIMC2001]|uniref:glycosyltransferase family 4 protein n=1 Tax=Leptospira sp. GIMC2001 TaxID=1513297 RepID=UPI00234A58A1|nr:glycosyltransferase family 4 protein [Leptospira sp. GIMC2001]WCL51277.1 glycosyltransferase family 4 protein [Leptospira sp. GIMC2001]
MKILVFAVRLAAQGFGVDLVIKQLAAVWESIGYDVTVGCVISDIHSEKINMVIEEEKSVLELIERIQPNFIYIHTYPFWEYIPAIKKRFENITVIMHDHGDPTPELFSNKQIKEFIKKQYLIRRESAKYADRIITISEFIKADVGYKDSINIHHGVENVPDLGFKKSVSADKLKIGMLGRVGESENEYKGIKYFIEIAKSLDSNKFEFHFCGHGKLSDAKTLIDSGIQVRVNLSEEEKINYLRGLDIFISTSLWEGFNLPLLEAQALGTLSIVFDTGAHPEVSIFNFSNVFEIVHFIEEVEKNRELLLIYSNNCYTFVRSNFSWLKAALQILALNNNQKNIWSESINNLGKQRKLDVPYIKLLVKFIRDRGIIHFIVYGFKKVFRIKN